MKNKMGLLLMGVAGIIGTILAGIFAIYLFLGFLGWIFSDPLDLFEDYIPREDREDRDIVACREAGGFPKRSSWDGSLKECMPIPK